MSKTGRFSNLALLILTAAWIAVVLYAGFCVTPPANPNEGHDLTGSQMVLRFGFNQLHLTPPLLILLWLLASLGFIYLLTRKESPAAEYIKKIEQEIFSNKKIQWLISLLMGGLFWLLRSNYKNKDFLIFKQQWYPEFLFYNTIHVRFDEMWESFLHVEWYRFLNANMGWSIETTFQLISCACGLVFIFTLLKLCPLLAPRKPLIPFAALLSGGFMQLFFGDMEHYTICATFIFLYFLAALLYIRRQVNLVLPAFLLMAGMVSHMAAIFLLPSLLYLFIIALERRHYASLLAAGLAFAGLLSFSLLFFQSQGASLSRMVATSWGLGRGGSLLENIAQFTRVDFWGRVNLIGLIFPSAFVLAPPLLCCKLPKKEHDRVFLWIAALSGLLFFATWISTIGLYMDWNLFSLPLIPLAIYLSASLPDLVNARSRALIFFVLSLSCLMTYSWIFSNHFSFLN